MRDFITWTMAGAKNVLDPLWAYTVNYEVPLGRLEPRVEPGEPGPGPVKEPDYYFDSEAEFKRISRALREK